MFGKSNCTFSKLKRELEENEVGSLACTCEARSFANRKKFINICSDLISDLREVHSCLRAESGDRFLRVCKKISTQTLCSCNFNLLIGFLSKGTGRALTALELEAVRVVARLYGASVDASVEKALLVNPLIADYFYGLSDISDLSEYRCSGGKLKLILPSELNNLNVLKALEGSIEKIYSSCDVHTFAGGVDQNFQDLTSIRVAPYSVDEERLSERSTVLSQIILDSIKGSTLERDMPVWYRAINLPLDDLLFSASVSLWSIYCFLRQQKAGVYVIVTDDRSVIEGLRSVIQKQPLNCKLLILSRVGLARLEQLNETTSSEVNFEFSKYIKSIYNHKNKRRDDSCASFSLVVGGCFDRNYQTDVLSVVHQLRTFNSVSFMPSAGSRKIPFRIWFDFHRRMKGVNLSEILPLAYLFIPSIFRKMFSPINRDALVESVFKDRAELRVEDFLIINASREKLGSFLTDRIFRLVRCAFSVQRYIYKKKPTQIVLLPGRDYISQVAALCGRETGAKSFDVQTVFVGPRSRYKASVADYQFVIETYSETIFEDFFKVPKENLVLTGNSKVGGVQAQIRKLDRKNCRDKAKLQEEFLITFACSPILHDDKDVIDALASVIGDIPGARLAFRYHPTAHQEYFDYCDAIVQKNDDIFVADMLDLPETLLASDLIVTRFSNVGLEAALAGRNVISCNFSGKRFPISLDEMGVATLVDDRSNLLPTLLDIQKQGVIWEKLQQTRQSYIEANPQLFHENPPQAMCEFMRSVSR